VERGIDSYKRCVENYDLIEKMTTLILQRQSEVDGVAGKLMRDALTTGFVIFDSEFNRDGSVAVVQFMVNPDTIYIIRTTMFSHLPELVRTILSDSRIVKIGHSLESDERAMMRTHGIEIRSKMDVRHVLMSLGVRIPSMEKRSNLKELMTVLVPELPVIELSWWEKVNWKYFNRRKITYLEGDVRGVYEICVKILKQDRLHWSHFEARIPKIEDLLDRKVTQQAWFSFNC
jgi:hypothetical protein